MKFRKETEFQETEIGEIPRDWKVVKLGEVVEIWDKYRIPVKENERKPGPYPYCGANGIIDYIDGYTHDGEFVLLAEDGGFFRRFEKSAYIMRGKFWANNHVHVLKAIKGTIISEFLMHYLNFTDLTPFVTGSTRPKLNQEAMKKIPIALPSLVEQMKIADILSTIDRTIELYNRERERLERLKRGLMSELLTGRIRVREENGRLSFYRETEFQETEIGRIARDWKVVRLKDVAEIRGSSKITQSSDTLTFIPMEAIPDDGVYAGFELRDANEVKSYVYCEPGDILLAKITPSFENGKQGIVPEEIPGKFALATTEVYPIRCKNINKFFLFYLLKYPPLRNKLASLMRGTTGRKRVPREALEDQLIPYPPLKEQENIGKVLLTIQNLKESMRDAIVRLERLKRGLMDLLLTGKVRVKGD